MGQRNPMFEVDRETLGPERPAPGRLAQPYGVPGRETQREPPIPTYGPDQSQRRTLYLDREKTRPAPGFLVIVSAPYTNTVLRLSLESTKLGRDGQLNDHVIDDPAVGRQHLSIRYQEKEGVFVATDLDTANGTTVNGKRIDRQVLATNDVIVIGRTKMVLLQLPKLEADAEE